jgi:hypothetical protein
MCMGSRTFAHSVGLHRKTLRQIQSICIENSIHWTVSDDGISAAMRRILWRSPSFTTPASLRFWSVNDGSTVLEMRSRSNTRARNAQCPRHTGKPSQTSKRCANCPHKWSGARNQALRTLYQVPGTGCQVLGRTKYLRPDAQYLISCCLVQGIWCQVLGIWHLLLTPGTRSSPGRGAWWKVSDCHPASHIRLYLVLGIKHK